MNDAGFICLHRGEAADALLADRSAFCLLVLICLRARWRVDLSPEGLRRGEARIGADDVNRRLGLTRKEYRCALNRLVALDQITVLPVKGQGTIAKLGPKCVFSTEVRKRAIRGAIPFPSQNEHAGADCGAVKGPLRNNETMDRVQNPGPKPPGFESRVKRTKRERPQAADSLSLLSGWIAEVQSKHPNRVDIERIAKICAPIRNAAHLERLVENEHDPKFRKHAVSKPCFDEPKGWREFLRGLPTDDWRSLWADRDWAALPEMLKEQLTKAGYAA